MSQKRQGGGVKRQGGGVKRQGGGVKRGEPETAWGKTRMSQNPHSLSTDDDGV